MQSINFSKPGYTSIINAAPVGSANQDCSIHIKLNYYGIIIKIHVCLYEDEKFYAEY